jgi:ribosomal-protein-alanine N-acetyltransferase
VAEVAAIERVAFSDPWSERDFRECIAAEVPFLVAEEHGAVAGYVIARQLVDEAEILNLGVAPARQRHGIGRALVQAMLERLAELQVVAVFLEVRESNAVARRLYAGLGFGEVGRRRNYYRLPKEDAMILRAAI